MNIAIENITLIVGILVILIGLWGLLTQKNLIKMVIGFVLCSIQAFTLL